MNVLKRTVFRVHWVFAALKFSILHLIFRIYLVKEMYFYQRKVREKLGILKVMSVATMFSWQSTCLVFFSIYAHTIQILRILLQHSLPSTIRGALKDASLLPIGPVQLIMMDIQSKRMRQRSIENLRWCPIKFHPTNLMSPCIAPIQFVGVKIDGKSIGVFKISCLEAGPVWTVCESTFNSGFIIFPVSPKQQPDKRAKELCFNWDN